VHTNCSFADLYKKIYIEMIIIICGTLNPTIPYHDFMWEMMYSLFK